MNKLVDKAGFNSQEEMRFKEELRFLRPVSVQKKKLKRQPSGAIDSAHRVVTRKDVPSVKQKLMSRELVGKYPLSLKLGNAKKKKKKTLLYAWGARKLLGLGKHTGGGGRDLRADTSNADAQPQLPRRGVCGRRVHGLRDERRPAVSHGALARWA